MSVLPIEAKLGRPQKNRWQVYAVSVPRSFEDNPLDAILSVRPPAGLAGEYLSALRRNLTCRSRLPCALAPDE